jgi:cysteine desulfurase
MFWKRRVNLDVAAGISGNPSSPHEEGRRAKDMLEGARATIARLVEVQADDIIFTSGATEGNALAMIGHVHALRLLAGSDTAGRNNMHVLYLPSAHASIVENAKLLAEEGIAVEALPIREGRVDTEALEKLIRPETVLVSMEAVCGETGVVWNTREVAQCLRVHAKSARLHVDASQAPWTEKLTRAHFDADIMTLDASKVCQERGIGALIAHRTIPLVSLYKGGGQERGLRPGSESPALARSFAAALAQASAGHESFRAFAQAERVQLIASIKRGISNVYIQEGRISTSDAKGQVPNILNVSLPGRDTDYLVALLDEEGFAVSTRSACETDSEEDSRAVFALTGDRERARSTLRISWGPSVRASELRRFAAALARAVAFIDSNAGG